MRRKLDFGTVRSPFDPKLTSSSERGEECPFGTVVSEQTSQRPNAAEHAARAVATAMIVTAAAITTAGRTGRRFVVLGMAYN